MNFITKAGIALIMTALTQSVLAADSSYQAYIPEDKRLDPVWVASLRDRGEQKVYQGDELRLIGMPCGGIGAGQIEISGTGMLGTWWIFNESPHAFSEHAASGSGDYEMSNARTVA